MPETGNRLRPGAVHVITVPYDSGRLRYRMGLGPVALMQADLQLHLASRGFSVTTAEVHAPESTTNVLGHTLELAGLVSAEVRAARAGDKFPIVLAGNCFMSVGAVAGFGGEGMAVVWFDAHGDLNTPDTSGSGFLDGMAAAAMLGWCYSAEAASISGFTAVPGHRFVLVGARALDAAELEAVQDHRVEFVAGEQITTATVPSGVLDLITADVGRSYLHLDLDVLDPLAVGHANSYSCSDGLTLPQVFAVVKETARRSSIAGLTISSYEPAADENGSVCMAALDLICGVAEMADNHDRSVGD